MAQNRKVSKLSDLNIPEMHSFITQKEVEALDSFYIVGARKMTTGKGTRDQKENVCFSLLVPDPQNPKTNVVRDMTLSATEPRLAFIEIFKSTDEIGPVKLQKKVYDDKKEPGAKGNEVWVFVDAD